MPSLTIIAECNGAGKSTFASSLLPDGLTSFDYDKHFIENYYSLSDSELRDLFAKEQTITEFENSIEKAIKNKTDYCYETNFDIHPIIWAEKFKENSYQLNLIFFCLEAQDIARYRIQVRTEFKGHFVDNKTIDLKWKAGYKNVNIFFSFFDNVLFVDNSKQNDIYTNLLQIEKGEVIYMTEKIPEYFDHRLPDVKEFIKSR